jgi:hypothetical protein
MAHLLCQVATQFSGESLSIAIMSARVNTSAVQAASIISQSETTASNGDEKADKGAIHLLALLFLLGKLHMWHI